MTRIFTTAYIDRPPGELYDFVTTPGNWPLWHPSSLGLEGDVDHSMTVGEKCTEAFRVAGREGKVVWTITEREPPRRWVIEGVIVGRDHGGTITYNLAAENGGTRFNREFVYPTPNPLFWLLDKLFVRRRVQAESDEALRRLKQVLETQASKSAVPHP